MMIETSTPGAGGLSEVVDTLREWQSDAAPFQLHPGDLGWFWRFGAAQTAAAVRTWRREGRIVAIGLLDRPDILRLTMQPGKQQDRDLAQRLGDDLTTPGRGVLPEGRVAVEAPNGALLLELLSDAGWPTDQPWVPLSRDLTDPVADLGVRVEVIGADQAGLRSALQRASFDKSRFTKDAWHLMASGLPYADARCLVAYDDHDTAVAAVTVWSAGPGKPGLLEPMGVHRDHRGHGYGRAITVAAAAALQEMGSSSATVCTRSSNVGGVATYESAGFTRLPERRDRYRDA